MNKPLIQITFVKPSDARGWIGFGSYSLVLVVLAMIAFDKALLKEDAFLILATALVITGWVNGPIGWAYQATQGGGAAADSNARIAERAVEVATKNPASVDNPDAEDAAKQVADAAVDKSKQFKG